MSTSKTTRHRWNLTYVYTQYNSQPPYQVLQTSHPAKVIAANSSVTYGDNYPDWRKRIFLNMDATTTLTGVRFGPVRADGGSIIYSVNGHTRETWFGQLLLDYVKWNSPAQSNDLTADSKARSKFLSHYISAKNTWRGGNFLAEVRETIHMLRSPVKSLFGSTMAFAKDVARMRKLKVKDLRKTVADAWLTWSFGVKPLIDDCNDAGKALDVLKNGRDGTRRRFDSIKVSGFGKQTVSSISVYGPVLGSGMVFDDRSKIDYTTRYTASLSSGLEDSDSAYQEFGVGVYDVVPAVWEAIPWSFFIDYFTNVGEMIDSCRLWSASPRWCYRSIRNAGTSNFTNLRPQVTPAAGVQRYASGGNVYTLSTWVNRASAPLPSPGWRFKMPGVESMKWLNIAALREQVFHASGRRF